MCLHRCEDLSREEFPDYRLNKHGPYSMENASKMRAIRYVQDPTISTPMNEALHSSRGMVTEFDCVAEV
ncbi:EthD domain-containing protein [Roseibium sp.]|uniref:EthD domain-containing protein n=1 Tax=Roseibium sp. TaxID=1936156 RepID=UPI003D1506B5